MVFLLFKISIGQEFDLIGKIDSTERKYLEYLRSDNVAPASFAIDSTTIYLSNQKLFEDHNTYMWKYNLPFSKSNPQQIKDFIGNSIQKFNNNLINNGLNIINLNSMSKFSALGDSIYLSSDPNDHIRFAIYDSTIYYFWRSGYRFRNLEFFRYDLRDRNIKRVILDNYRRLISKEFGILEDIHVLGHNLYSVVSLYNQKSDRSYFKLFLWDILNDNEIAEFTFPKYLFNPKIIGTDKWHNIFIISGSGDSEYPLYIFSPDLDLINSIDLKKQVMNLSFMNGNTFLDSEVGGENFIICTFNDNKELFLMVKTVKGLYFLKYDYLYLLSNYYEGKSKASLRILRNMIFAQYGRSFNSEDLNEYFKKETWYRLNSNYSDKMLSDFDKQCIRLIRDIESHKNKN